MNETFTCILLSLQAGVPWRTVKGFRMTDFPNLKTKYPDLIPIRMDFECGPGWEQVLDAYSDEAGHRFRFEAGQSFRFHSGRCSDLKPAIFRTDPGSR
ncbi:hypothetical protein ACVINZ_000226 [Mesorhizobium jarvisii]